MNASTNEFFDQWLAYGEILARDYMHHDEIFGAVAKYLAMRFEAKPFEVLDLGCGNASHLARALAGRAVRRYVGYDLSEVALAGARGNLVGLGCAVHLRRADLRAALQREAVKFDLIVASFALHHLSALDKLAIFQLAAERLTDGGMVLVVDTFRASGETRELYLDRYCDWLGSRCQTLDAPALAGLIEHIRSCDFPEQAEELARMAGNAGLNRATKIHQVQWHESWGYEKAG
jgi:SAM-dependent methyltransferase